MYKIYTEPSLYVNSKRALGYSLTWLSKTFNEGTCESFLKNLKDTDEAGKPLDYETVENLCFIRFNGPNPLMAKTLIRGELNKHVQKKAWHFITDSHKYFISATVSRKLKTAREEFSFFD